MSDHGVMNKLWRLTSPRDVNVFIYILTLFMTIKHFKAVIVMIPLELHN